MQTTDSISKRKIPHWFASWLNMIPSVDVTNTVTQCYKLTAMELEFKKICSVKTHVRITSRWKYLYSFAPVLRWQTLFCIAEWPQICEDLSVAASFGLTRSVMCPSAPCFRSNLDIIDTSFLVL
jgi:hypothetical protein